MSQEASDYVFSSWWFIENLQQETHQAELLTVKNSNKTAKMNTRKNLMLCPLSVLSGANTICMILLSWLILFMPSAMHVLFAYVLAEGFYDSVTDPSSPGHLLPPAC